MFPFVKEQTTGKALIVPHIIYNGEKMEYAVLDTVFIISKVSKEKFRAYKQWHKIRRTVYRCYPYVKTILYYLKEIEDSSQHFSSKKEKRQFLRRKEKEVKERFSARIRNMTLYEGEVLLKLLHRETNITGYKLIKDLRGGFSATIYQGIALLFGGSLKYTYDTINNAEDKKIESIYQEVQKVYGF